MAKRGGFGGGMMPGNMNNLMKQAQKMQKQMEDTQAELEVISDNYKAISLYKELGFEKCGHFPNNMKYADGKYADADWMMKKL